MPDRRERRDPLTYAAAGVDVAAGDALVARIAPMAAATARPGVMDRLGGFGALFDPAAAGYRDPVLVAATDGVGTKLRLAIDTGVLGEVGIDLVAMCVNDLLCQGAEPLFFLDYFATGALSVDAAAAVVGGVAEGCRIAGCALIGGETAEMPGMYAAGDFDLAGFAVGAVERGASLPQSVAPGDVLLGLAASGAHSNGFSLLRRLAGETGLRWSDAAPFANSALGEALLTPTRIYIAAGLAALRAGGVHGIAHITGGGITGNLPRMLPSGIGAEVALDAWPMPPIFAWAQKAAGLDDSGMLETFNCGLGLVLAVSAARADALTQLLQDAGETVYRIGRVSELPGLHYRGRLA
ncbi:MAG: phosphoribosylformylglycinamidine cyclo-ligase [Pseudomonadota bacterium]